MILGVAFYLVLLPFLAPRPAALCLLCLASLFALTRMRQAPVSWSLLVPVLPFLASNLLATLRADSPVLAAGFFSFMLPGLILFIILSQDRVITARSCMQVLSVFALVMALSVLVGWLRLRAGATQVQGEDIPQAVLRLSGNVLLTVPNDVCVTAILAAFPLGLLMQGGRRALRGWAMVTLLIILLALALVRSRTGLLIAGAEILLAVCLRPRLLVLVVPLCLLGIAADAGLGLHSVAKITFAGEQDFHGVEGRFGLWVAGWRMFLASPLFGHGAQSFGPGHWAFLPSWAPRFPEGHVLWAHNLFLDLLAEQGFFGLAAFGLLFAQPLRRAWRAARHGEAAAQRSAGWAALSAFGGFFLAGLLELSLIRRYVPLTLFALLGFAMRLETPEPVEQQLQTKPAETATLM